MSEPESPAVATRPAALRIALLGTKGIPANYGGFETFAEQLAVRLVERGHQVTVYAEANGPAPADTLYQGVRIRFRRRPRWGPAAVLAYDCSSLWDARRSYDLVYMLGYGAAWACWWPRVFGTPVWINVDGLEWARSKWSKAARAYLRCMEWLATKTATRLIADADAIAQRVRSVYPRSAPTSFIAYGAQQVHVRDVDVQALSAWGLEPGGYLLVVARPEPENHVLEIIQGYLLYGGRLPLIVVGAVSDGTPYQRKLQSMAGERVRLIGGVYDAPTLQSLRVHAAAYLHGHSVGGTNPSLLEALACGSLVIAHDNPFNREVAQGVADYFQTPAELATCLHRLGDRPLEDAALRRQGARDIIASRYTWEGVTAAYEALMFAECGAHVRSEVEA
jgi:glycosyltransferase involved in cell wall biosynthesis